MKKISLIICLNLSFNLIINSQTPIYEGVYLNRGAWPFIMFQENGTNVARIQGNDGLFRITGVDGGTTHFSVNSTNGRVGIGTDSPSGKLQVMGGNSIFDPDYNLYIPSTGPSYFWKGIDGIDNVRFSVWSKLTLYNPTTAGLNTNNSGWNIQLGARDGSIYTRGGAYFALSADNVGIATASPSDKLQIGDFNNTDNLKLNIPGVYNFEQIKLGQYGNGVCGLELVNHSGASSSYGVRILSSGDDDQVGNRGMYGLQIQTADPSDSYQNLRYTTRFAISTNGNVGIGTSIPDKKLTVKGTIHASEVIVDLNIPADFVFEDNYKMMNLNEIESFVRTNKHLPEIPSAKEIKESGLNIGDMQNKLLQKIEEMTLYMIEQNKKIETLQQKVIELEKNK